MKQWMHPVAAPGIEIAMHRDLQAALDTCRLATTGDLVRDRVNRLAGSGTGWSTRTPFGERERGLFRR